MAECNYSSIYLPRELKERIAEVAQGSGFRVGRGRRSELASFIDKLLREHESLQKDPDFVLISSLTPRLRSVIIRLSDISPTNQEFAGSLLNWILDWREANNVGE